jgi:hypothetical protein
MYLSRKLCNIWYSTVIPRLTKIIRSGITFVSRNVMLAGVSLLAVSNVNNPVGLVGLPYVMWSAHFLVTHIQTEKISSWNGPWCVRGRAGRPARPRTQHDYHHDTKVKPEAATAVIVLLMMGAKTPETCRAVNKRQDNKLKNCGIRLASYLNCTMMHGLINRKFYI